MISFLPFAVTAAPLSFLTVAAMAAQLAAKKCLTLEVAKQMAAAAEAEARKNQWNVVVAIVDDGGNLIYLQRMDDTQIGSIDVAQQKAQSAIRFKRPSKVLEDVVTGGRIGMMQLKGSIPVEGGLPIAVDGKIIGAIGISGVQSNQDGQIAKAGVDALPGILGQ